MNKVHYSSGSDEWETPQELFSTLNEEFNFSFDLCANDENAKCEAWTDNIEAYITDALTYPGGAQHRSFFMNPPYSRGKQKLCIREARKIADFSGGVVVMLIPARTDTTVWHEYVWNSDLHAPRQGVEVRLLKGRIKFEKSGKPILDKSGRPQSAPFPSAVIIFRGER